MAFRLIPGKRSSTPTSLRSPTSWWSAPPISTGCSSTDTPQWEVAADIQRVEQGCDTIAHEIFQRLNRTFVTPIDREDIHALATSLDDVMDAIDAAATVIGRYRVSPVRFGARELAQIFAVRRAAPQGRPGARAARRVFTCRSK